MKKEIPITTKNVFTFLLFVLMTVGFTFLFVHFSDTIKDEPAEEKVLAKYSKKGLYLYPRFEVQVSNSERPSTVSKEQFDSIELGDAIPGYMKNAETFVTEKDIRFELTLGVPILILLYFAVFFLAAGLLKSTSFIKNRTILYRGLNMTAKGTLFTILTIYILTGLVFTTLTATNIVHKLSAWNLTEAEATVLGGDWNETRSNRGASYTTYELFLEYADENGEDHITKKAVTGETYNKYLSDDTLPILYRNNKVDDTFIKTKNINEILPAFLNLYTFFIGFYFATIFAMIKAWRKKKRKEAEQETDSSTG